MPMTDSDKQKESHLSRSAHLERYLRAIILHDDPEVWPPVFRRMRDAEGGVRTRTVIPGYSPVVGSE